MMKWINEGGIFFPTLGEVVFLDNPGNGVFQIATPPNPMDKRLGLRKVSDEFEFDFKIYDIGCEDFRKKIKTVWNSKNYNKNLGVILNGFKGSGKTLFAKTLCNELGLPVILVDDDFEGQILQFITNLNFECVVFLDEAEKTFNDSPETLLKLIDGAYNNTRKLYLLTTNELTVDKNLIDRPGRVRYIQEFGNLLPKAVSECIDDNLKNPEYKELITNLVDRLEFSTIDILKNIIEEVNILGPESVTSDVENLNIPISSYVFKTESFEGMEASRENIKKIIEEAQKQIDSCIDQEQKKMTPQQFLRSYIENPKQKGDWSFGYDLVAEELKDCSWVRDLDVKTTYPDLKKGVKALSGTVLEVFEEYPGFFIYHSIGYDYPTICFIIDRRKPISVYNAF